MDYASDDYTCGVITVFAFDGENTNVWRDLRVRKRPENGTSIDDKSEILQKWQRATQTQRIHSTQSRY